MVNWIFRCKNRYLVENPSVYFAIAEAVGGVDISLGIKMGVQFRYILFWIEMFGLARTNRKLPNLN